jgi:hypothetical protein
VIKFPEDRDREKGWAGERARAGRRAPGREMADIFSAGSHTGLQSKIGELPYLLDEIKQIIQILIDITRRGGFQIRPYKTDPVLQAEVSFCGRGPG